MNTNSDKSPGKLDLIKLFYIDKKNYLFKGWIKIKQHLLVRQRDKPDEDLISTTRLHKWAWFD